MPIAPRVWAILATLPLLNSGTAFCQQLAFTSRAYVQSPVVIASVEHSKEFGFDSVVIQNDAANPISAVHFRITFRTDAGDEIADEHRFAVNLEPRESKRMMVALGHIEGLKQQARSRKQASALVSITIESVEFQDGSEWKQIELEKGTPIDTQHERIPRK
jgi:cellobiose phosphorylase